MNRIRLIGLTGLFFYLTVRGEAQKTLENGSLIIALVSRDTIWLGADTRTSSLERNGYSPNSAGMCKIYSAGKVIYAMSGHIRYTDDSFNFARLLKRCINKQNGFSDALNIFRVRAAAEIRAILKSFSASSVNTLIETNNGSFLSVLAISFNGGEQHVRELRFFVKAHAGKKTVTSSIVDSISAGSLRFLGHSKAAAAHVRQNSFFFGNGTNVPAKILELISIEAKENTTVGLPADVISIYDNGFRKVVSSGHCDSTGFGGD